MYGDSHAQNAKHVQDWTPWSFKFRSKPIKYGKYNEFDANYASYLFYHRNANLATIQPFPSAFHINHLLYITF